MKDFQGREMNEKAMRKTRFYIKVYNYLAEKFDHEKLYFDITHQMSDKYHSFRLLNKNHTLKQTLLYPIYDDILYFVFKKVVKWQHRVYQVKTF